MMLPRNIIYDSGHGKAKLGYPTPVRDGLIIGIPTFAVAQDAILDALVIGTEASSFNAS